MIVYSEVETEVFNSDVSISEVNSQLRHDVVYSEELDYTQFEQLLRITQQNEPRITQDNEFRIIQ